MTARCLDMFIIWYVVCGNAGQFFETRTIYISLTVRHFTFTWAIKQLKPATGRPYVRAFSLSGTVPAFTCDCLRFVCAFTPRPKVDLCVSTFSRTMLAFGNNVSLSSSACSTLAFCRQ